MGNDHDRDGRTEIRQLSKDVAELKASQSKMEESISSLKEEMKAMMKEEMKAMMKEFLAEQRRDLPPRETNPNQDPQSSEVRDQEPIPRNQELQSRQQEQIRVPDQRVQIHEHQFPQYHPSEPIRVEKLPFRQQEPLIQPLWSQFQYREPPIGHQEPAIHQHEPLDWRREQPIGKPDPQFRYDYFNPPIVETAAMVEGDWRIDNQQLEFLAKESGCRTYLHPDTGDGYEYPRNKLGSKPRYDQYYSDPNSIAYGQSQYNRGNLPLNGGLNSFGCHDNLSTGLGNLNCGKSAAGCVGMVDQNWDSLENQTEGIASLGDDGWKVDKSSSLEKVESVLRFVDNKAEMQDHEVKPYEEQVFSMESDLQAETAVDFFSSEDVSLVLPRSELSKVEFSVLGVENEFSEGALESQFITCFTKEKLMQKGSDSEIESGILLLLLHDADLQAIDEGMELPQGMRVNVEAFCNLKTKEHEVSVECDAEFSVVNQKKMVSIGKSDELEVKNSDVWRKVDLVVHCGIKEVKMQDNNVGNSVDRSATVSNHFSKTIELNHLEMVVVLGRKCLEDPASYRLLVMGCVLIVQGAIQWDFKKYKKKFWAVRGGNGSTTNYNIFSIFLTFQLYS